MQHGPRKLTRFFIINPVTDRRLETRFESKENVDVRDEETEKVFPAIAFDIGRHGLRLETTEKTEIGKTYQIAFLETPDNIRCFAMAVWVKKREEGSGYETGLAISAWHGIVMGKESWEKFKGVKLKRDRRRKTR